MDIFEKLFTILLITFVASLFNFQLEIIKCEAYEIDYENWHFDRYEYSLFVQYNGNFPSSDAELLLIWSSLESTGNNIVDDLFNVPFDVKYIARWRNGQHCELFLVNDSSSLISERKLDSWIENGNLNIEIPIEVSEEYELSLVGGFVQYDNFCISTFSLFSAAEPYCDAIIWRDSIRWQNKNKRQVSSIPLWGTLRDFKMGTVRDFGVGTGGSETGVLNTLIGGDRIPTFNRSTTGTIFNSTTFNQWYRDVSGVNVNVNHAITLTLSGREYSYTGSPFLPLNGGGWAETNPNYGFTYEIHTTFVYSSGGYVSLECDDDCWLFADNKLELDIGGIHGSVLVSKNLTGYTVGNTYNIDIFYAERGATGAVFIFKTNLVLNQNMKADVVGCSDRSREGFTSADSYPCIAACSATWQVAGLRNPVTNCDRRSGNDSPYGTTLNCSAQDACAAGWHVCQSAAEVATSLTGGTCANIGGSGFFATAQSSGGCAVCWNGTIICSSTPWCTYGCANGSPGNDDFWGCGSSNVTNACGTLNGYSGDSCASISNFDCNSNFNEVLTVTKSSPLAGGVLCCKDTCTISTTSVITSALLTTSPLTTSRLTTSSLTTSPLTTARITSAPLTTAPLTTAQLTTSPLTTSPLTTSPLTTAELTTSPLFSQEMTTSPITSADVTSSPLTTSPLSTAPLTTTPLTSQEMTTSPLTTGELTTAPLTTAPLTSQEMTTSPLTTGELTTAPLTTAPLTTSPLSTSPITSGDITSSPLTSQEMTSSPLTTSRLTSSPLTTSPLSTAPLTSQEMTSSPITSSPLTTSPLTSREMTTSPLTTSPLTSQEMTTSPVTSSPLTTAEITTSPLTTAPLTTAPLTTAMLTTSPLTSQEMTTSPLTTSPLTTSPLTTAHITSAPLTTAPLTTAQLTTSPLTTAELTTSPLTSQEMTSSPLTTSRLTTSPLTSQEMTTSPITSAPLTTKEMTTSPITTLPLTTAEITTSPLTTSHLTSQEITTSPLTTFEVTSSPLITLEFTSNDLTTAEITTSPLTSQELTTSLLTTNPLTSDSLTSAELTSSPLTTFDVSSQVLTTSFLTTAPLTSAPLTSQEMTTSPITTAPLTTQELTSSPFTTEAVTTSPLSSQEMTTSPISTAPLTTAELTTSPLTTQEMTTSPITTAPLTSAELTTSPLTTQEMTTSPLTSTEVTTSPLTSQEITTSPVTSSPLTTAELTTSPLTTARITSAPLTTSPLTTAPLTTAMLTTSPLTSQEMTTSPITTAPLTTQEMTTSPITTVPLTSADLTTFPLTTSSITSASLTTQEMTSSPLTSSPLTTYQMTSNEMTSSPVTTNQQYLSTGAARSSTGDLTTAFLQSVTTSKKSTTGQTIVTTGRVITTVNIIPAVNPVSPSNRVVIQAVSSNPDASFTWSVISGFTFTSQNLEMGPQGSLLILKRNSLTPGQSASFRVVASDGFSSATAETQITAANAPSGGSIIVNNKTGAIYSFVFKFEAISWIDNGALLYRFISIDSKGVQSTLRSLREENNFSISFASPENLTIGVIVQNAMLVESSAFVNISVRDIVIENVTEVLSNLQDSVNDAISSGNVDQALQSMQSTSQLINTISSGKNETNATSVKNIQEKFLSILSNISQTTVNATQDSALIQLKTLNSVVSLGSTEATTNVAMEVASALTSKITLKGGEVLDTTISSSVVSVLDSALSSITSTTTNSTEEEDAEAKKQKSVKVMETLSNLFQLQIQNRVCGETPIGTESESIKMLAALPNPSQIGTTSYSPPGSSTSVKFPAMSVPDSGCFRLQLVGLKVDLNKPSTNSSSSRDSNQKGDAQGVVGVNLFPGDQHNIPEGVLISIPTNGTAVYCGYRPNITSSWQFDNSCRLIVINSTFSICNCTHLTEFTVFSVAGDDEPSEQNDLLTPEQAKWAITSIVIIGGVALFGFMVLILMAHYGRQRRRAKKQREQEAYPSHD